MEFPPLPGFVVDPRPAAFLGYDTADLRRCWSGESDSVAVIGPPRYGKSSGLLVPTLLSWPGAAVVTSTRGDLLRASGDQRARLAGGLGGRVHVYDPAGSEPGVISVGWSPLAGCTDASLAYRRAAAMTAVVGVGVEDASHWQSGAARILRAFLHAAALDGRPVGEVRSWIGRQDAEPAAAILDGADTPARYWLDDLVGLDRLGERERGSFYALAADTLEATADPRVLASTRDTGLDVDRFLRTGSTLYVVGPSHMQAAMAPMVVGLIDSIAQRAAELAAEQGGRLAVPLLLALDEVANVAPLSALPQLVSEGGGRGILTLWAAQSLSQLRVRYGADTTAAILTASTCKLIYGGMSNGADLRDISLWAGEYRQADITTHGQPGGPQTAPRRLGGTVGGLGAQSDTTGGEQYAVSSVYRPALPPEAIQQTLPFRAWLWHRSDAPLLVDTRPAGLVDAYARLAGYTPPAGHDRPAA